MYKRPLPRAKVLGAPKASGCGPSRVGEMIEKLRAGCENARRPVPREWSPPTSYEFLASLMPDAEREVYLARCKEWFDTRAAPTAHVQHAPQTYDTELVAALFAKHAPDVPPLAERLAVYRAAGYSPDYIEKAAQRAKVMTETIEERTKVLDAVFAKWPAANKTVPVKGKVIKAVKKRL